MTTGVTTTLLSTAAIIDEVIGNRASNTVKILIDDLASQLGNAGPLADALNLLSDNVASLASGRLVKTADLTYASGSLHSVSAGDLLFVDGFCYEVAASNATDQNLITSGGVRLYVKPGPGGTTSFEAFGAKGDGVTNASSAVQAALKSGLSIENPRGSVYLVTATIRAPDANTRVRGGTIKSTIAAGNVIELHHTTPAIVDWADIAILTTKENMSRGLSVTYTGDVVSNYRHIHLVTLRNLVIGGTDDQTGCFGTGVYLDNANRTRAYGVDIRGRRNLSAAAGTEDREYLAATCGFRIKSSDSSQPVLFDLTDCHVRHVETSVQVRGALEGVSIKGGQYINCKYGIDVNYADLVSPPGAVQPGLFIRGTHINAASMPITVTYGYECYISDCELYRFSNIDGVAFTGIVLNTCSEMHVHSNVISAMNTTGTPGTTAVMDLTNIKRSRIERNIGRNSDTGVTVKNSGSVYNVFADNATYNGSVKGDFNNVLFVSPALETNNAVVNSGPRLSAATAGVTIAATTTNVVSLSIPDAIVGEVYRVRSNWRITKGATAGVTSLQVVNTGGTGAATFEVGSSIDAFTPGNQAAAVSWRDHATGLITITTSGTVQLTLQGKSTGSDATVAAGEASLCVEQVR